MVFPSLGLGVKVFCTEQYRICKKLSVYPLRASIAVQLFRNAERSLIVFEYWPCAIIRCQTHYTLTIRHPQGGEPEDNSIEGGEIRGALSTAITDQQLVFEEHRLCGEGSYAPRA
jgi:hypothetical protein